MSSTTLDEPQMQSQDCEQPKETSRRDSSVDEAFDQAEQTEVVSELSELGNEAQSSNEPQTREAEKSIYPGTPLQDPIKVKTKKIKATKLKIDPVILGGAALLLSLSAVGIAGYTAVSQKAGLAAITNNAESLDSSFGGLVTTTDELIVELAGTKKLVQANTDRWQSIDGLRQDVEDLQTASTGLSGVLEGFENMLGTQGSAINEHQSRIGKLENQMQTRNTRVTNTRKKASKKAPGKAVNTDTSLIEGAYVASIDLWGTEPYVMLRAENGNWVPLTTGDYYKGWRLEETVGIEAVFQKASKQKRLTIKE